MLDKIMELLGKENINNIKIPKEFKEHLPTAHKMAFKRAYYIINNKFEQPIVLDKNNVLVDGYTTYLIEKERGTKYVQVERLKI